MTLLFGRSYRLTIGPPGGFGRSWSGLRIAFEVERSTSREPNSAKIQLWNLDPVSRAMIESGATFVTLHAGYGDLPQLLFQGEVQPRGVVVERDGVDRVVNIEAGDGALAWRETQVSRGYAPGIPNSVALVDILKDMGLALGTGVPLPSVHYGSGLVLFGPAREALAQVCADAGVEFSIQDGQLILMLPGVPLAEAAILLSPDTGLVGAPKPTKEGLDLEALLMPSLRPGRMVSVVAETVSGFYRVEKVRHAGDSYSGDWRSSVEASPVGGAP